MTRTNSWKAAGMLLLAGLVGGAAGSALTAAHFARGMGPHGGPRRSVGWYVEMLDRELDLSPTQEDSVRAVLTRHRAGMDSIMADIDPRMKAWRDALRAEVGTQLTAEQQARYATLTARLDTERNERSKTDSTNR